MLVKASIAGAIVTNTLFMLGASFFLGGLKHHTQEFNRVSARMQAGLLFLATVALLVPSAIADVDSADGTAFTNKLSVGIALGSASQIALFVAPALVLLSYVIGPASMDMRFWPGAVVMMLTATLTASLVTNGGRSAWFVGVLVLTVYLILAMTLYLLPPAGA